MNVTIDQTGFTPFQETLRLRCLGPTKFWPVSDRRIFSLLQRIIAGKETDQEKVLALLEWLTPGTNIKYNGERGSRYGVLQVLKQKYGHCWDFSDVFITLARAAQIPCRQVAGWLYGTSGHVWAEYYIDGKGWQQVDPTGGGELPCGIYHIPMFTTESGEMPILYVSMPAIRAIQKSPL